MAAKQRHNHSPAPPEWKHLHCAFCGKDGDKRAVPHRSRFMRELRRMPRVSTADYDEYGRDNSRVTPQVRSIRGRARRSTLR
jgi:hypothetical protein